MKASSMFGAPVAGGLGKVSHRINSAKGESHV
jgi:hypothetical protein